jgi:hypothetical protein
MAPERGKNDGQLSFLRYDKFVLLSRADTKKMSCRGNAGDADRMIGCYAGNADLMIGCYAGNADLMIGYYTSATAFEKNLASWPNSSYLFTACVGARSSAGRATPF